MDGKVKDRTKPCLAISYSKLGDLHQALGRFGQALQFVELDTNLTKELYEANSKNVQLKHGLAVSYYKLAGIYMKKNQKALCGYYLSLFLILQCFHTELLF
ncbi:MAG: hypothetical protein K6U80_09100 [Firmicutes bacterium]|nr:hypothetical protein [Bacillota bacterium]